MKRRARTTASIAEAENVARNTFSSVVLPISQAAPSQSAVDMRAVEKVAVAGGLKTPALSAHVTVHE